MASSTPSIGWFGLGLMGIGMALNLQKRLQSQNLVLLRYSNRTLSRGEPLKVDRVIPEDDFERVVRTSSIIFTMVSDDQVLDDLLTKTITADGSLEAKIFVDISTVHPDTCAAAYKRLAEIGASFTGLSCV